MSPSQTVMSPRRRISTWICSDPHLVLLSLFILVWYYHHQGSPVVRPLRWWAGSVLLVKVSENLVATTVALVALAVMSLSMGY